MKKQKPGGYVETRAAMGMPKPIPVKPFFQRAIRSFTIRRVDGVDLVHAAHLSCGHTHTYRRRQPAPSKRTTAPCEQCGAGLRMPYEIARQETWMQRAILGAIRDERHHGTLVELIEAAVEASTMQPLSERAERVYGEIHRAALGVGLLDRPHLNEAVDDA